MLLGVLKGDSERECDELALKVAPVPLLPGRAGKMNLWRSTSGARCCSSASSRSPPTGLAAGGPRSTAPRRRARAEPLCEQLSSRLRGLGLKVATGRFGGPHAGRTVQRRTGDVRARDGRGEGGCRGPQRKGAGVTEFLLDGWIARSDTPRPPRSRPMAQEPQTTPKKELVNRISEETGHTKVIVQDILQRFLDEIIGRRLSVGNRLEFREFGVFEVRKRAARTSPRTRARSRRSPCPPSGGQVQGRPGDARARLATSRCTPEGREVEGPGQTRAARSGRGSAAAELELAGSERVG